MAPKILIMSPPRMGTQSTCDALEVLGYNHIYHMREVDKSNHAEAWAELMYGRMGENYDVEAAKTKLAELLEDFDGIADFPASIYVEELLDLYPDAKILIMSRDEDAWIKSMWTTLVGSHNLRKESGVPPKKKITGLYHQMCWKDDFAAYGRDFGRSYKQSAIDAATKRGRNYLKYDVREGWKPLCEFLDKPVPEQKFPSRDDWVGYKHALPDNYDTIEQEALGRIAKS